MRKTGLVPVVALLAALLGACSSGPFGGGPAPPPRPHAAGGLYQDAAIFDAVRAVMASARERLWVEMYEFGRQDLAETMVAAHERGADVRLVYDPSVSVSRGVAGLLRQSGVEARPYPLDDRRHQIDHVKLLVADGGAVVGGMNWGTHSAANHDYAVEIHEPGLLGRLDQVFSDDWRLAGGPALPVVSAAPAASEAAITAAETTPGEGIRQALLAGLASARQRVWAEVFVLTDGEVLAALAGAARRGASVRVLLDPNQDVNRPSNRLLQQSGVAVRWYPVAPGAKLHAKVGLFDDRLLVGSANWSRSGLSVNHELDLLLHQPAASAAFASRFTADWALAGG